MLDQLLAFFARSLGFIVRIRYGDPIGLLAMSSITANLKFTAQATGQFSARPQAVQAVGTSHSARPAESNPPRRVDSVRRAERTFVLAHDVAQLQCTVAQHRTAIPRPAMVRAACHCTAVRFEIAEAPAWVLDCNCTICRRYGAIRAYPEAATVTMVRGADDTDMYVWGDRELAFHRCRQCGCVTHMTALETDPPSIYGIDARMILDLDPASVRVRQKDNGHTRRFWTRSSEPPEPSRQPKTAPPDPDDWR